MIFYGFVTSWKRWRANVFWHFFCSSRCCWRLCTRYTVPVLHPIETIIVGDNLLCMRVNIFEPHTAKIFESEDMKQLSSTINLFFCLFAFLYRTYFNSHLAKLIASLRNCKKQKSAKISTRTSFAKLNYDCASRKRTTICTNWRQNRFNSNSRKLNWLLICRNWPRKPI